MLRLRTFHLEEFERAIERRLETLASMRPRPAYFEEATVREFANRYELRLWASCLDPRQTEVEAERSRLIVRVNLGHNRCYESVFAFACPVAVEAVEARWSKGLLTIVLPKLGTRRIVLEES